MATKILDLDYHNLPAEISGLESYNHALLLIRLYGRPVGQVRIPVDAGKVEGQELREKISQSLDWNFWHQWLVNYLSSREDRTVSPLGEPVTVAVCTRDRAEDLHRCLLALLALPGRAHEIIVVDSCSVTEETKKVVEQFEGVKYIRENVPGLNRARNRALREAEPGIVVFTDDDAIVDPGWLDAILPGFQDPLVLCVTGLTMPFELETEAQEIFEHYSSFNRGFTRRVYDNHSISPFLSGHAGAGANMALRRKVLELVGPFDEALDAGTPTYSGGDNEMFSRILASGFKIVYEPGALSWHRHRRSWKELRKTIFGYGVGIYAAWTRSLLVEREFTVFLAALSWLLFGQLPALLYSVFRRPESKPLSLLLDEMVGCFVGPWAYLYSRAQLNR
jgi:glycosyltransferase involved in cell wall biosynthesis